MLLNMWMEMCTQDRPSSRTVLTTCPFCWYPISTRTLRINVAVQAAGFSPLLSFLLDSALSPRALTWIHPSTSRFQLVRPIPDREEKNTEIVID